MLTSQVCQIIDELNQKNASHLDKDTISFLEQKGLISTLSSHEYLSSKSNVARRLYGLRSDIEECKGRVELYHGELEVLQEKLGSIWHKLWSSKSTLDDKQKYLKEMQAVFKNSSERLKNLESEREQLEESKKDLELYVDMPQCCLKPTKQGMKRAKQISARKSRLENVSYDEFDKEISQVENSIQEYYGRFKQFYEFLIEKGFERHGKVVQYALSLSGIEGDIKQIYKRANVINAYLYEKKWTTYKRLRTASAVAAQEGDINPLKDQLIEIFISMHDSGVEKSYALWFDAANIMKLEGTTTDDKIKRYHEFGNAVYHDWNPASDSAKTREIVANLAMLKIPPRDAAQHWLDIKKKLFKAEEQNLLECHISSALLTGAPGTSEEKAQRFYDSFLTMNKYGWKKESAFYPAAAVVSLLPGTAEENIQLLDDAVKMLKNDGFENRHPKLTKHALHVIVEGYKQIVRK